MTAYKFEAVAKQSPVARRAHRSAKSSILNLRLSPEDRAHFDRAAAVADMKTSELVRSAAKQVADEIIKRHSTRTLNGAEYDALMDILDDAVPISPTMRAAAERVDNGREDLDEIRAAFKESQSKRV